MSKILLTSLIATSVILSASASPLERNDGFKSLAEPDITLESLGRKKPPGKIPGPPVQQNFPLEFWQEIPDFLQPKNGGEIKVKKYNSELLKGEQEKMDLLHEDTEEKRKKDKKGFAENSAIEEIQGDENDPPSN